MTIAAITATPTAAVGRCVTVSGIGIGRLIAADVNARYRQERIENDPSSNGAVLGLYHDESFRQPRQLRATGVIGDCAAAAANPALLPAQQGYCQYFKGLFLTVASVELLDPVALARLPRGEAPAGLGNLSPLPAGDVRRRMQAAANGFLAALRAGNRAALAAMHGGGPNGRRPAADLARVEALLFSARSPFAALRVPGNATIEIFGWRDPLWADADWRAARARTGDLDAIACISVRPNAAALWPIDSKDADNTPDRPYACTRIHIGGTGADAVASFDTEQARTGVAEPGVTAATPAAPARPAS